MTLEKQAQGHTVLFSYEAWGESLHSISLFVSVFILVFSGHVRPLCVLATHIVKTRPIYVTFLTCSRLLDRIETEISRCFSVGDKARSLIR